MSTCGTTNQLAVPPRSADIELVAQVRERRREFVIQAASEPTRLASLLKSARSDAALVDLLVVKVLQELPTVGKVKSRRALADHGHDEFVAVGQLSDVDIESLIADVLR